MQNCFRPTKWVVNVEEITIRVNWSTVYVCRGNEECSAWNREICCLLIR